MSLHLSEPAQLALDTIHLKPTHGVPCWMVHLMNHSHIERLAGANPGDYRRDPVRVYLDAQRAIGVCSLDQFIADNPLTMSASGYDESVGQPPPANDYIPYNPVVMDCAASHAATTGSGQIILDGMLIDSPEATVEHLERFVFPHIEKDIANFDEDAPRARDPRRGAARPGYLRRRYPQNRLQLHLFSLFLLRRLWL